MISFLSSLTLTLYRICEFAVQVAEADYCLKEGLTDQQGTYVTFRATIFRIFNTRLKFIQSSKFGVIFSVLLFYVLLAVTKVRFSLIVCIYAVQIRYDIKL